MGNRLRLVLAALACIAAGKTSAYENFKVAIYCRAQEVQKMADPKWLDKSWRAVSNEVHVDRIYIETYRDRILIDDATLEAVKKYFAERGTPELFEQSSEVEALRGMREALVPRLPVSQKSELRQRLQKALDQENYELAAILRDELRQIKDEK